MLEHTADHKSLTDEKKSTTLTSSNPKYKLFIFLIDKMCQVIRNRRYLIMYNVGTRIVYVTIMYIMYNVSGLWIRIRMEPDPGG